MSVDRSPAPTPAPRPRAPRQESWDAMTAAERAAVVKALAAPIPAVEVASEGDVHFESKADTRATLRKYFERSGRKVYVGAEIGVYYPDEERFVPDLLAVADVETHRRSSWVVSAEGRGVGWVMEILVEGDRRKDVVTNVQRYGALGVEEYFVFDRARKAIRGWRQASPGLRTFVPIVAQGGWMASRVLGLEIAALDGRVRLRQGTAELRTSDEIIQWLEDRADELVEESEQRLAAAEEAVQQEAARRVAAETRADTAALLARADALRTVLAARGLVVDEAARATIAACADPRQLDRWIARAVTAAAVADLFDGRST
ncbi:MAG: hypothetical protein JWM10_2122 [Myxococcaceae bacterium]|nr:hypothetical protein [Myxococcaceae bacterium]